MLKLCLKISHFLYNLKLGYSTVVWTSQITPKFCNYLIQNPAKQYETMLINNVCVPMYKRVKRYFKSLGKFDKYQMYKIMKYLFSDDDLTVVFK